MEKISSVRTEEIGKKICEMILMYQSGEPVRIRTPRHGEVLGIVEAMLGTNKLRVRCQDDKIRMCRIPGKLRKSLWMREGDVVLVKPWSIQGTVSADIVTRYTQTQVSWLKRKNILRMEY